jgi:hypothetical protein
LKFIKLMKIAVAAAILVSALAGLNKAISAQTTYTTGFESPVFTLGDVNGQNGWGYLSNSPTKGIIETAPAGSGASFGAQSLAVRTNNVDFFGVHRPGWRNRKHDWRSGRRRALQSLCRFVLLSSARCPGDFDENGRTFCRAEPEQ